MSRGARGSRPIRARREKVAPSLPRPYPPRPCGHALPRQAPPPRPCWRVGGRDLGACGAWCGFRGLLCRGHGRALPRGCGFAAPLVAGAPGLGGSWSDLRGRAAPARQSTATGAARQHIPRGKAFRIRQRCPTAAARHASPSREPPKHHDKRLEDPRVGSERDAATVGMREPSLPRPSYPLCGDPVPRHSIRGGRGAVPASVAELADAPGLGPGVFGRGGSSPSARTSVPQVGHDRRARSKAF